MAIYGFSARDREHQAVLVALRSRATKNQIEAIDTLAQYQIVGVQIVPRQFDVEHVNPLQLVVKSRLLGMNNPDGLAVMMHNPTTNEDVYPIDKEHYIQMVKGGLYDNPIGYERSLANRLVNAQYFRSTKANFESLLIRDNENEVSLGDYSPNHDSYQRYYIGRDLVTSQNLAKEVTNKTTNFETVLQPTLKSLEKNPIKAETRVASLPTPEQAMAAADLAAGQSKEKAKAATPKEPLAVVSAHDELDIKPDLSADETPDEARAAKRRKQSQAVQSVEQNQPKSSLAKVMTHDELDIKPEPDSAMMQLLNELNAQAAQEKPSEASSFNDDFATALQEQQKKRQQQRSAAAHLHQLHEERQAAKRAKAQPHNDEPELE